FVEKEWLIVQAFVLMTNHPKLEMSAGVVHRGGNIATKNTKRHKEGRAVFLCFFVFLAAILSVSSEPS
ncbi:MAG: hypothetical protein V3T83_15825, partial [Acidobacteriota bacterium]